MSVEAQRLIISQLTLRKAIGTLGVIHPFILLIGGYFLFGVGVQFSMSTYYYTGMRDIFVSIVVATGIFLYAYKGYNRVEDLLGNMALFFAMGIAYFPMTPDVAEPTEQQLLVGAIHNFSAASFLLLLAYFSICLFTKTNAIVMTERKKIRNRIYRLSGYLILICVVLMAIIVFGLDEQQRSKISPLAPIFWLETLGLAAFGLSWWVKGEAILQD